MSTRDHLKPRAPGKIDAAEPTAEPAVDLRRVAMQRRAVAGKAQSGESGAQPLDAEVRGDMEAKLGDGNSFGDVRVHADSAEASGAHAVAKGQDLHFGKDKYQPGTKEGNWLIA